MITEFRSLAAGTLLGVALFTFLGPAVALGAYRALRSLDAALLALACVSVGIALILALLDFLSRALPVNLRNGWPVAMKYLWHGDAGPLVIPNTVAIVKGCPHAEEARAAAAFLLSETTERMLAQSDSHNTPVTEAVARDFPRYAIDTPLVLDYAAVAEKLPVAVDAAVRILR